MRKPTPTRKPAPVPMPGPPNPNLAALIDYAVEQVSARLPTKQDYGVWLAWAEVWRDRKSHPGHCVNVANECFSRAKEGAAGAIWNTLGQLCWAGKEACYTTPTSGWYVIRYVADAMVTFGVAFPEQMPRLLSDGSPLATKTALAGATYEPSSKDPPPIERPKG